MLIDDRRGNCIEDITEIRPPRCRADRRRAGGAPLACRCGPAALGRLGLSEVTPGYGRGVSRRQAGRLYGRSFARDGLCPIPGISSRGERRGVPPPG